MKLTNNKTALVTGGGTGLGYGVAKRLLEQGAKVLIVGRREDVLVDAKAKLLEEVADANIDYQICDITQEADVEAAVKKASNDKGELDILIANAGSGFPGPLLELDAEAWNFCCQLNIVGTALCIKHGGKAMQKNGGSIITISSTSGTYHDKWMAPYGATKAALEHLTKTAAIELASFNIRVNCIAPGYIPTPGTGDHFSQDLKDSCVDRTLLDKGGEPKDIGDAAVFLSSDMGQWITGQILAVDGGLGLPIGTDFVDLATSIYGEEVMQRSGSQKK